MKEELYSVHKPSKSSNYTTFPKTKPFEPYNFNKSFYSIKFDFILKIFITDNYGVYIGTIPDKWPPLATSQTSTLLLKF